MTLMSFGDILSKIVKVVEQYVKKGAKEIVLLGQNVNSYGKDFKNGDNFAKLLEIQFSGKKRVLVKDYLRGNSIKVLYFYLKFLQKLHHLKL